MEYMKIGGFLGRAVSKMINKAVETKVGFKPNIELHGLNFQTDEEENYVNVNLTARMTKEDFEKLIEEVTK